MTLTELKNLVRRGEGQTLEFKKKADHPEKIVREMVAFSNSGGGLLLIGVDDNGLISGLKYPEEEKYAMEAAIALYAKPEIHYSLVSVKTEPGREVLVYTIPDGKEKPYYWLADKSLSKYRVYVRHSDQSLQASIEMVKILKSKKNDAGIALQFTSREKRIFAHLEANQTITLSDFSRIAKVPVWIASRILVYWVIQGIFTIEPGEDVDLYALSNSFKPE